MGFLQRPYSGNSFPGLLWAESSSDLPKVILLPFFRWPQWSRYSRYGQVWINIFIGYSLEAFKLWCSPSQFPVRYPSRTVLIISKGSMHSQKSVYKFYPNKILLPKLTFIIFFKNLRGHPLFAQQLNPEFPSIIKPPTVLWHSGFCSSLFSP